MRRAMGSRRVRLHRAPDLPGFAMTLAQPHLGDHLRRLTRSRRSRSAPSSRSTTPSSRDNLDSGELNPGVVAWAMDEQRILVGDTDQTRRNDRLTDVENRAQWIVRGIREESVDLVSVATAASCGEHLPSMRGSACSSPTRRRCMACRATPPTHPWSGRMQTRRACTSASLGGGCTTSRSWSRGRTLPPASFPPSRCSAARRTDDSGCCTSGSGGDAARGTGEGLGGDGNRTGCWGVGCWARDGDVEALDALVGRRFMRAG